MGRRIFVHSFMNRNIVCCLFGFVFLMNGCQSPEHHDDHPDNPVYSQGSFGYDLEFLQKQDSSLVVLQIGEARVIVSPKYQAKVFTSTASGNNGFSFGWINYKAFGKTLDPHMNAYGGENRLWLGPEGGKYSLFFKPDSAMVINNWKTPAPIDVESWDIAAADSIAVAMSKEMSLLNYAGTSIHVRVNRKIEILDRSEINKLTGLTAGDSLKIVGYETENILTNTGIRSGQPSLECPVSGCWICSNPLPKR